jgi:uracil-DNA glycosylase
MRRPGLRATTANPTFRGMERTGEEGRFRQVFRRAHAGHVGCAGDEWLMEPCRLPGGEPAPRPLVWSRRNGRWGRVDVLWVGAAPGNAGGRGRGALGAHGTRIPFGGDIAGANLDVLLSAAGLDRNGTFIVAALNRLPDRGGGEPSLAELREPVGGFASSVHLLRATLLAAAPRLVVCLGNVALRSVLAATRLEADPSDAPVRLPPLARLQRQGLTRGAPGPLPAGPAPDAAFHADWADVRPGEPLPHLLWLLHPSAQNMSPYAGTGTVFHQRMLDTLAALRPAVHEVLGTTPPDTRPALPTGGIYDLPEWREAVGPRHAALDRLWREKGV